MIRFHRVSTESEWALPSFYRVLPRFIGFIDRRLHNMCFVFQSIVPIIPEFLYAIRHRNDADPNLAAAAAAAATTMSTTTTSMTTLADAGSTLSLALAATADPSNMTSGCYAGSMIRQSFVCCCFFFKTYSHRYRLVSLLMLLVCSRCRGSWFFFFTVHLSSSFMGC